MNQITQVTQIKMANMVNKDGLSGHPKGTSLEIGLRCSAENQPNKQEVKNSPPYFLP